MDETFDRERWARECDLFCRYLLGRSPEPAVVAAYCRAHAVGVVERQLPAHPSARDRALLQIARIGPAFVRAADAYAAVFARSSLLRRKLVLLLAILESGGAAAELDHATPGSRVSWILSTAIALAAVALRIAVAAVLVTLLLPWYALRDARTGARATLGSSGSTQPLGPKPVGVNRD